MKLIGIITVGRVDWNIWKSIIKSFENKNQFKLKIIALGMHFSKRYGMSYKSIKKKGLNIDEKIKVKFGISSPENISYQYSEYSNKFSKIFKKNNFDFICIIGDRFESLAAASICSFYSIPIIHFHGGEKSEGSLDDSYRHAISKLSHVHLVSNELFKKRLVQLGEEKWRIKVVGAPGIDNLRSEKYISKNKFLKKFKLNENSKNILVLLNAETIDSHKNEKNTEILIKSIINLNYNFLFTLPNFDLGSSLIRKILSKYKKKKNIKLIKTLGDDFASTLKHVDLVLGNSSAGIIETGFFKVPTINIGKRQDGRIFGKNIINIPFKKNLILKYIDYALSKKFKKKIRNMNNPYGKGFSHLKIKKEIKFYLGIKKNILINKKFIDYLK